MNHFITVLKKYAVFSGRSSRAEYWIFTLISFVISVVLAIIDSVITSKGSVGFLGSIYALAIFIPSLSVSIRRMHDIGKSGWMILVPLIPIIGVIWYLILTIKESEPNENQYGSIPSSDNTVEEIKDFSNLDKITNPGVQIQQEVPVAEIIVPQPTTPQQPPIQQPNFQVTQTIEAPTTEQVQTSDQKQL